MLKPFLNDFLVYCKNLNLAQNSVKDLLRYIRRFDDYLQEQRLGKVNHITCQKKAIINIQGDTLHPGQTGRVPACLG